jgi:hypothetical protein
MHIEAKRCGRQDASRKQLTTLREPSCCTHTQVIITTEVSPWMDWERDVKPLMISGRQVRIRVDLVGIGKNMNKNSQVKLMTLVSWLKCLAVYLRTLGCGFVNWDDQSYNAKENLKILLRKMH